MKVPQNLEKNIGNAAISFLRGATKITPVGPFLDLIDEWCNTNLLTKKANVERNYKIFLSVHADLNSWQNEFQGYSDKEKIYLKQYLGRALFNCDFAEKVLIYAYIFRECYLKRIQPQEAIQLQLKIKNLWIRDLLLLNQINHISQEQEDIANNLCNANLLVKTIIDLGMVGRDSEWNPNSYTLTKWGRKLCDILKKYHWFENCNTYDFDTKKETNSIGTLG